MAVRWVEPSVIPDRLSSAMRALIEYCELPLNPRLNEHVQAVWRITGVCAEPMPQEILPDGCVTLLLNFAEPIEQAIGDGVWVKQSNILVIGELTRRVAFRARGRIDLLGVRLWPDVGRCVFDAVATDIVGGVHDTAIVQIPLSRDVARVLEAPCDARGGELQGALARQIERRRGGITLETKAVRALFRLEGKGGIQELADECGVSRRHLERRFVHQLGIGPKALACVVRFRSALRRAACSQTANWTQIAAASGYCDHSHLVRDFVRYAGAAPSRLSAASHALTAQRDARRPSA